jgi:hypothetical protein
MTVRACCASPGGVVPLTACTGLRRIQILLLLGLTLLLFLFQGCAAVGITMLGMAAGTVAKAGISYTMDGRAQKTFTAPVAEVKTSLLAALGEMALPIVTDEQTEDGQRIVASVESREAQIELEAVTPKATRIRVVVHEGWWWKDRATAEEIIEQTSRGVDGTVLAARAAAAGLALGAALPKTPPGRASVAGPTPVALDPWDAQRWREGFQNSPPPAMPAVSMPVAAQSPVPAVAKPPSTPMAISATPPGGTTPPPGVAFPLIAVVGAATPPPDPLGLPENISQAARLAAMDTGSDSRPQRQGTQADDNVLERWRVLRTMPLRPCPDTACAGGPSVKRGDVVLRLRERGRWWRVWIAGTEVVGWIPADELAPLRTLPTVNGAAAASPRPAR